MKLAYKKNKKSYSGHIRLLLILLTATAFGSCVLEPETEPHPEPVQKYGRVTISLVPQSGKTRVLTNEQQEAITSAQVLVFDRTTASNFVMMATTDHVTDGTADPADPDAVIREFSVRLPTGNYDIVLLANSGKWIDESFSTAIDGIIPAGTSLTLSEVQNALKASVVAGKGWNADAGSSGYIPLPMIGTKKNITVLAHDGNTVGTVELRRAVAKVDVLLTTDAAKQDFDLQSVRVYNYPTGGYLFPGMYNQPGAALPTAPHDKPYRRTVPVAQAEKDSLTGDIFLFEFDNQLNETVPGAAARRICLVLGGYYQHSKVLTYYRMDFRIPKDNADPSKGWKYLDVERNTHYQFNITKVTEAGWPDEEVAFRGEYRDMRFEVVKWEDMKFPNTPL